MRKTLRFIGVVSISTFAGLWTSLASAQPSGAPGTNVPTPVTPPPSSPPPGAGTTSPAEPSSSSLGGMSPTFSGGAADPNEPVMDTSTTRKTFFNRPLFVTGLVLLGGSYAASAAVAATSGRPGDDKLYYPVVGPWLNYADRDKNCVGNCPNEDLNKGLLIADGIVQGLGALSILGSLFVPEKTTRHWYLIGSDSFRVSPSSVGRYGYGLAAVGTF